MIGTIDRLPVLEHHGDAAGVENVLKRIGIEDHQIGKLARLDGAEIGLAEGLGHPFRRRLDRLHRRQARILDHHRDFLVQA